MEKKKLEEEIEQYTRTKQGNQPKNKRQKDRGSRSSIFSQRSGRGSETGGRQSAYSIRGKKNEPRTISNAETRAKTEAAPRPVSVSAVEHFEGETSGDYTASAMQITQDTKASIKGQKKPIKKKDAEPAQGGCCSGGNGCIIF